jgi:3-hydroxybutyryl-CoA dehydrogenase
MPGRPGAEVPAESTLAVVGAGAMGSQIAYQAALHGYDVRLISRSDDRLRAAGAASEALLRRRVEKGTLDGDACEAALGRVTMGSEFDALAGAGTIIESVAEDRDIKREVYARICGHADDTAIIGTNSSTLASSLLESAVTHPERFLNIHFFNPALLMALVEVVPGPHTAEDTVVRAMEFARAIGKTPVRLAREEFGFIANRILFIAVQEAMRLVQGGYISVEDCDLAVRNALGWPMGPFQLSDLVGLDVVEAILDEGFRQTGDQRWEPVEMLRDLVAQGRLGRKTGGGFFTGMAQ